MKKLDLQVWTGLGGEKETFFPSCVKKTVCEEKFVAWTKSPKDDACPASLNTTCELGWIRSGQLATFSLRYVARL